jgi:uncharacterized protein (TIRG00374 family)
VAEGEQHARQLDPDRLRRGVVAAVAIGAAVGVGVALLTDGKAVLAAIEDLPLAYLAGALALSVASWFGQGVSWGALTGLGLRGNLIRWTKAFLGGDFVALVTPFGSGGIPGGVFTLVCEGLSGGAASAAVAVHSLLTSVFFVVVGVLAAILLPMRTAGSSAAAWAAVAVIIGIVTLIAWVALRPLSAVALLVRLLSAAPVVRTLGQARVDRWIAASEREAELFATAMRALMRERPAALVVSWLGLTFSRACQLAVLPVVMYGLGYRGDIVPLLATAVGAMVIAVASPTPGGSGTVEAGMTALLSTVAPVPTAAASAILWRGITYYSELFVGWAAFSSYLAGTRRG